MESYTVVLSDRELEIIGRGLAELPYKYAEPVIRKLVEQTERQDTERAQMKEEAKGLVPEARDYRTPTPEEFREAMRKRNAGSSAADDGG